MDPELKKALEALGLTQAQAIEAQQKAHKDFVEAHTADEKKRDAVYDEKLAKLSKELDKFEPLSAALKAAEEREKAAADERKEQQAQLDRIEAKVNRPGLPGEGDAEKAKANREAFIEMCRVGTDRMKPERVNVLTVSDDTGGGYLAPPEYVQEIIKGEIEYSPMRSLVRVRNTSQRSVQLPRRTGTFSAVWVGEIATRAETPGLNYGMHDVPVHELTAEVYASMADLEDSAFDLSAEFSMEFSEQFGVAEGAAIISGNSVGKPEGFLNAAGIVGVNSGDATKITADGILDLKHSIKTSYAANATFVLNRTSLRDIRKLKNGDGQYLWVPGLAVGKPNAIDGDPYVEAPDMPNPGAGAKPIAYGDWRRGYTLVDRLSMAIVRDPYTRASVGQVKFVARRRLGGAVTLAEAIAAMTVST